MTDRHELLSALKRATVREIEVAGVKFYIRGITGAERFDLVNRNIAFKKGEGKAITDAELCSWAICSLDGERLYQNADELTNVDGDALATIANAILEASKLRREDQEEAEGKSEASPS